MIFPLNIDTVELINKVHNCSSNTTSGEKEVKERFLEYELKKVLNSTSDNKFSTEIYESLKEKSEAAISAASPDYVLYKSIRQEAQKFVKIRHHRTSLGVINTNPRLEVEVRRIQFEAELKMIDSQAKHYKDIELDNVKSITALEPLFTQLPRKDQAVIRAKLILMCESLTVQLDKTRKSKEANRPTEPEEDHLIEEDPIPQQEAPKPQRKQWTKPRRRGPQFNQRQ